MVKIFKTKNEALNFIKKLSFNGIIYNRVEIRKGQTKWLVTYYE